MKVMQLVGKFLGEKMTRIYEKVKLHTEDGAIHRSSAEIRAEITESDIPSEIARQTEVEEALAGKVDKEAGKELMPSPGEGLHREYFLNASGQWEKISPDAMVITMTVSEDKKHFLLDENELGAYLKAYYGIDSYEEERNPDTVRSHIGVYLKYAPHGVEYKEDGTVDNIYTIWRFLKVIMTSTEYGIPHLIARENKAEYDGLTIIEYYCQIDIWSRNDEPLKPHVMYSSISQCYVPSKSYVDDTKAGKADLQAHIGNASIHRTSAEIRAEITEADIPAAIARDAEVEAKILEHHESGEAHADLRNALANLESGAVEAGSAEYARKLGTAADSYTKTQLDAKLNRHIRDVVYDTEHAKFTFVFEDGREIVVDTPLENTVTDGHYDNETLELVLVLVSGQEIRIPVAGMTKVYTGKDTATATTTITPAGEVSVALKTGGVDAVHLSAALSASINSHLTSTGDTKDNMVTFPDQSSRTNLASGDKHSVLFGKIKRWFTDLKALAFKDKAGKTDLDTALQNEIDGKVKLDGSNVMSGALYINNRATDNELRARFAKNSYADAVVMSLNDAADVALCSLAANVNNVVYYNGNTSYNLWHAGNLIIAPNNSVVAGELGNKIPKYTQSGYLNAVIFRDSWAKDDSLAINEIGFRVSQDDGYHRWCSLARLKTVLGSMPANGGNADTLGGLDKMNLGRIVFPMNIDDTTGFVSGGYTPQSGGTRPGPGTYGCLLQVSNNTKGPAGGDWVFQIAHAHGEARPYWRTQYNNGGWAAWKQLAFVDDILSAMAGKLSQIPDIVDASNVSENGAGRTGAATINIPVSGLGGYLVNYIWDINASHQMFISLDPNYYYTRIKIGGEWQAWKRLAFVDDMPSTDNLFTSGKGVINQEELNTFVNRASGTYRIVDTGSTNLLVVFRNPGSSTSGLELYADYRDGGRIQVRKVIDEKKFLEWKTLAYITDIPDVSGLLSKSGGALTGRLSTVNVAAMYGEGALRASIMYNGLTPITSGAYHSFLAMKSVEGNTLNFGGIGNNIGFYGFLHDRTENGFDYRFICNTANGEWFVENGGLTLSGTTPEHVLKFRRNGTNKGYIGLGATTTDLILQNAVGKSHLRVADDGKCYANGKEIATVDQIGGGNDNYYPTVMNWTDGSVYGPRLNLSGIGMSALSATIPVAGISVSGVVSTMAQTFAGKKSFNAGVEIIAGGINVNGGVVVTNGSISCTDKILAVNGFYETSDIRLKKNVVPINLAGKRIRLYEFDRAGKHSYGVIAQQIEEIYPTAVKEENGYKVVNYTEVLTIKCAEQDNRITALEKENSVLKERLEKLEKLLLK